ncbi:hypothetical protein ABW19_dt0201873 [Dactylella cylindrospora]|nr:hypothetical protein ABW19_dt0201873 [Dactylella cylindrospora]
MLSNTMQAVVPISRASAGPRPIPYLPSQPVSNPTNAEPNNNTTVYLNLEAVNIFQYFPLSDDWTIEQVLENARVCLVNLNYFHGPPEWTCDLIWGHYSARNLLHALVQQGETSLNLKVKDLFYGGELIKVHIYDSLLNKHFWDYRNSTWKTTPAEALRSYTLFGDPDLAMGGMMLGHLRLNNRKLRRSVSDPHAQVLSAVVFVGMAEFRMAIVKEYRYSSQDGPESVVINIGVQGDTCLVKDATGRKRCLKFWTSRGIWIQDETWEG